MRPILRPLFILALALGAVALPAAGCSAGERAGALRASYASASVAATGFASWDGAHQMQLVDSATSSDDAHQKLVAYRERRDDAVKAIADLFQLIAAAAALGDDRSLANIAGAYAHLQSLITSIEAIP